MRNEHNIWSGDFIVTDYLRELDVDGNVILKWRVWKRGLNLT